MRLDKFTIKSQEAIQEAQQFAASKGHQQVIHYIFSPVCFSSNTEW